MSQTETTVIIAAVIVLAIVLRVWRATREQRINLSSIWVAPIIFLLLTGWVLWVDGLFKPADILLAALAVAVGGAIGMYQGTHTTVRVDRQARAMYVKAKPIGALIFVVVIALRLVIRLPQAFSAAQSTSLTHGSMPLPPQGGLLSIISAMLLAVALGLVVGLRLYLLRKFQESDAANG
ncbi:MAG TPA: hypothetical protein VEJ41_06290 [Candidatus Acidoferrales bacterium]|nr:hypothetical protein [Candidatus Acidoferrales bacterium]